MAKKGEMMGFFSKTCDFPEHYFYDKYYKNLSEISAEQIKKYDQLFDQFQKLVDKEQLQERHEHLQKDYLLLIDKYGCLLEKYNGIDHDRTKCDSET